MWCCLSIWAESFCDGIVLIDNILLHWELRKQRFQNYFWNITTTLNSCFTEEEPFAYLKRGFPLMSMPSARARKLAVGLWSPFTAWVSCACATHQCTVWTSVVVADLTVQTLFILNFILFSNFRFFFNIKFHQVLPCKETVTERPSLKRDRVKLVFSVFYYSL